MSVAVDEIDAWLTLVVTHDCSTSASIVVRDIGAAFVDRLFELGFDTEQHQHGLDASLTRHILQQHGGQSEFARGQEPVTLSEMGLLHRYVEMGATSSPHKQFQKTTKKRVQTIFEDGNRQWTIVSEIRRKLIVPVTAWKKIL